MAKKRSIVAASLFWLGSMANAQAQYGYAPMPPGGMPPAMMPPGGMPLDGLPPNGAPPGMMPPNMMPTGMGSPGMMPPGMLPPGMTQPGLAPPGMMSPGMVSTGTMSPAMFPQGPLPANMMQTSHSNTGTTPPPPPGSPTGTNLPPSNAFFHGAPSNDGYVDPVYRGWQLHVDPFIMFYSGARFPALVTTGDINTAAVVGALGQPGTQLLYGGNSAAGSGVFGLRLALARNFGDEDRGSIDVSVFAVNSRSRSGTFGSDAAGNPVLTRPFFNPVAGQEDADIRAFPGAFAGTTHDTFTTAMYGGEANIRWDFSRPTPENVCGFSLLAGPRYFQFNESYRNFDTTVELPVGAGSTFQFADDFGTRNHFFGGQIGSAFKVRWDRVAFDLTGKLIGGNNAQSININGATRVVDAAGNAAVDNSQGLYAMPSNIGQWNRDRFSFGGEVGVKVGFQLAPWFRFNVGYTFLGINNIVRPGDQIDRTVNIQPLFTGGGFGVARPAPTFRETMLNTHTFNLGFEWFY